MQYLLTDYLDIQNIRMKTERSTGTPAYLDNSDITTYFTRRKPARLVQVSFCYYIHITKKSVCILAFVESFFFFLNYFVLYLMLAF